MKEKEYKKAILFVICIIIGILYSPLGNARRIKEPGGVYIPEEISLELLTSDEIWNHEDAFPEKYYGRSISNYIAPRLEEIQGENRLTAEDLAFVVACVKQEGEYMRGEKRDKLFLTDVILPPGDDGNIFSHIIDHLLWFYRDYGLYDLFQPHPKTIGYELERGVEDVLYMGVAKGLVKIALESEYGLLGTNSNLTNSFPNAAWWARPESRVQGRYGTDDDRPTLELHELNQIMGLSDSNRYHPVILAFDASKLGIDVRYHIQYDGRLPLNALTRQCKEILVGAFDIKEIKPWMDKEWREIILNYEGNF